MGSVVGMLIGMSTMIAAVTLQLAISSCTRGSRYIISSSNRLLLRANCIFFFLFITSTISRRGLSSQQSTVPKASMRDIVSNLSKFSPSFRVRAADVSVLSEPSSFFDTLLEGVSMAQKRIILSALYIGTGNLENKLVEALHSACAKNKDLKVVVLIDYLRGSRLEKVKTKTSNTTSTASSVSLLAPLVSTYPSQVEIYLYHTPDLRGFLKSVMPNRYNEIVGVQHIKAYIFDDDIVMSGANLSESYFSNRQDRYMLIRNASGISSFFSELVSTVSEFSYRVNSNGIPTIPAGSLDPVSTSRVAFKRVAAEKLSNLVNPLNRKQEHLESDNTDTWLFPTIQMGALGVRHDEIITLNIINAASRQGGSLFLASAYFNLTESLATALLKCETRETSIITAAPEANGFFGAKGLAGSIPAAYTYLEHLFHQSSTSSSGTTVKLFEYLREKWTFHAKGLWYFAPSSQAVTNTSPSYVLTMIGSPNFGSRSVERDVEAQIVLVTSDPTLVNTLMKEKDYLFSSTIEVDEKTFKTPERKVDTWIKWVSPFIRKFF